MTYGWILLLSTVCFYRPDPSVWGWWSASLPSLHNTKNTWQYSQRPLDFYLQFLCPPATSALQRSSIVLSLTLVHNPLIYLNIWKLQMWNWYWRYFKRKTLPWNQNPTKYFFREATINFSFLSSFFSTSSLSFQFKGAICQNFNDYYQQNVNESTMYCVAGTSTEISMLTS